MSRGRAGAAAVVLTVAALVVAWPRILAEYHYLKILRQFDTANSFMALYFLGPPGEPVLMRLLRRPETVIRQLAAESLRGSRDPEVIDALMKVALEDPEEEVRLDAVSALTHIGDPRALPILEESARRDSRTIPALLAMGDGGKSALLRTVTGGSPYDRGAALSTLCRRPLGLRFGRPHELDAGTREALAGALIDQSPEVRVRAAECAASSSGAGAVPTLEQMLRDEASLVRIQAAQELGRLGSQTGAQTLRLIIEDPSQPEDVRGAAARAVGHLGNKKDASFLRALARGDPSLRVRHSAYDALQRLFPTGDPEFDTYRQGLWPGAVGPVSSPTP